MKSSTCPHLLRALRRIAVVREIASLGIMQMTALMFPILANQIDLIRFVRLSNGKRYLIPSLGAIRSGFYTLKKYPVRITRQSGGMLEEGDSSEPGQSFHIVVTERAILYPNYKSTPHLNEEIAVVVWGGNDLGNLEQRILRTLARV